ncbi:hypothetical protein OBB02_01815 [Candidatus Puniceispirillum sp.]|nr:hypothetical protein [Candidatus Puniceispirillum sp.]
MSHNMLEAGFLLRIEGLLDALETRGKNSTEFLALCSKLQTCMDTVSGQKILFKQSVDVSSDLKNRLERIISRIEKLEIYSTKQTDITSNLQKHIVDADK